MRKWIVWGNPQWWGLSNSHKRPCTYVYRDLGLKPSFADFRTCPPLISSQNPSLPCWASLCCSSLPFFCKTPRCFFSLSFSYSGQEKQNKPYQSGQKTENPGLVSIPSSPLNLYISSHEKHFSEGHKWLKFNIRKFYCRVWRAYKTSFYRWKKWDRAEKGCASESYI